MTKYAVNLFFIPLLLLGCGPVANNNNAGEENSEGSTNNKPVIGNTRNKENS